MSSLVLVAVGLCWRWSRVEQGTVWPASLGVPPFDVRAALMTLHNGADVVMVPKDDNVYDYRTLLSSSVFCAVPRGGTLLVYCGVSLLGSCGRHSLTAV